MMLFKSKRGNFRVYNKTPRFYFKIGGKKKRVKK